MRFESFDGCFSLSLQGFNYLFFFYFLFIFAVTSMSSLGQKRDITNISWPYYTKTEIGGTLQCNFCREPIGGGVYKIIFT